MNYASDDLETIHQIPSWVTAGAAKSAEDVAFLSGAALSHLHLVFKRTDVPQALVRDRMALRAAEVRAAQSGRSERAGDLRDALAFLEDGDPAGPAGEIYQSFVRATERKLSISSLTRALPNLPANQIAEWLDAGKGAPVTRAAEVLSVVLDAVPRQPFAAMLLADAALAQALGWAHLVPLLSMSFQRGDLNKSGEDLRLACHQALLKSAREVVPLANDLSRKSARLMAVSSKLRAKGSESAVTLLLSKDAVAPKDLVSLNSARSARRFCDRLVELGVARELTGRETFRLYGL
ncbi:hypothetical protein TA5114_03281 [Cognatishimia activa]|uniref:DUF1403 family protein n=1 Tax=Cognatishimia activa TaxID=1715691 RepID=A0A0P1IUZ7_9RHOB|nr:DUF1403 family protein [Cognatishimia activa]CUK27453.1 hypothetical protein TA5114_03281 [Cognatishimia activa]